MIKLLFSNKYGTLGPNYFVRRYCLRPCDFMFTLCVTSCQWVLLFCIYIMSGFYLRYSDLSLLIRFYLSVKKYHVDMQYTTYKFVRISCTYNSFGAMPRIYCKPTKFSERFIFATLPNIIINCHEYVIGPFPISIHHNHQKIPQNKSMPQSR